MAGGGHVRERRSWPMMSRRDGMLLRERSFEAEDADDIPEVYRAEHSSDLKSTHRVSLHKILGPCQELGTRPQTPVRGQRHFTIADRKATFTGAWDGPHPDIMAQGGTFKMSRDSAMCYCCGVTFRGLTANKCIWTIHRQFAPNCRHLQRAHAQEVKIGNVRKFVRRLSTSDSLGLM